MLDRDVECRRRGYAGQGMWNAGKEEGICWRWMRNAGKEEDGLECDLCL